MLRPDHTSGIKRCTRREYRNPSAAPRSILNPLLRGDASVEPPLRKKFDQRTERSCQLDRTAARTVPCCGTDEPAPSKRSTLASDGHRMGAIRATTTGSSACSASLPTRFWGEASPRRRALPWRESNPARRDPCSYPKFRCKLNPLGLWLAPAVDVLRGAARRAEIRGDSRCCFLSRAGFGRGQLP